MKDRVEGQPPPEIPEHTLLRRIGAGSYGEVWLARSVTGVLRAVKIIHRDRFERGEPYEREFEGVCRYEKVSRGHAGLVDVLLVGRDKGDSFFYYVMELADDFTGSAGGASGSLEDYVPHTLQAELDGGRRLPVAECVAVGRSVTEALAYLHAQGLVHRDLKPSNLICLNGRFCLADIGMVTVPVDGEDFVGTHGYLPREGSGRPAADLFALGRVLYEALTGEDRQAFPLLPRAVREEGASHELRELNKVILKLCAHDAADRYADAEELAEDLGQIAAGKNARNAADAPRMAVPAAVLVLLVFGWWIWFSDKSPSTNESGLLLHWKFDGDLADASGSDREATGQWIEPTADRHGRPGQALAIQPGSRLEATQGLDWPAAQPRTVALWFRVDEWEPSGRGWYGERSALSGSQLFAGAGFALQLRSNGLIGLDGNFLCVLFDVGKLALHRWHHLAVTSNGPTGSARLWLNGRLHKPVTNANAADSPPFWWHPKKMFREVKAATEGPFRVLPFRGAVDEVRLYRRALTAEEIIKIHSTEKPTQPTAAGEAWDHTYHWADLNPAASTHTQTNQLRHVQESGEGAAEYWAPPADQTNAHIQYTFTFPRSIQRAHIEFPIYCVDLSLARPQPTRGAFVLEQSADGIQWQSIYPDEHQSPQWGQGTPSGIFQADINPRSKILHLRLTLHAQGATANFSPVQLGRPPNGAGADWRQKPVLRVKLAGE